MKRTPRLRRAGRFPLKASPSRDALARVRGPDAFRALDHVLDAVFMLDAAQRILFCNRAARAFLPLAAADGVGHCFDECIVLQEDDLAASPRLDIGQRQQAWRLPETAVMLQPDGSLLAVEGECTPLAGTGAAYLVVLRDVSEQRRARRWMSFQASHDDLTTLLNRTELERRLGNAIERARDGRPAALLYIDLDQFKLINDTCGHHAGDEFLRRAGKVLRQQLGETQPVARLGGDEFAVLLHGDDAQRAGELAESLIAAVRDIRFVWEHRVFRVSASVGIVEITREYRDWRRVLSLADSACFIAKEQGRSRVWVAREDDDRLRRRQVQMDWVARITGALEDNRFELCRQRITALGDHRRQPHWEVLTRLRNIDGTTARPEHFIPAAERYGLMPAIDRWVVELVMRHLGTLPTGHADHDARVAINVSGTTLSDPDFIRFIRSVFHTYGVDPHTICFEITETAAATDFDAALRFINATRKLGCTISLDDFGSGISSFSYLKAFDVDYLKIDGGFVRDMDTDPVNARFVESINHLGKSLGLTTVAEYVETARVVQQLRELGVDYAQGNYLGRPQQWIA